MLGLPEGRRFALNGRGRGKKERLRKKEGVA